MHRMVIASIGMILAALPAHSTSILEQLSPTPTSYTYSSDYGLPAPFDDGTYAFGPSTTDVTAQILRLTGLGGVHGLSVGCSAADYGSGVSGSIVLVSRGDCQFAEKAQLAQAAGALAVLIADNDPANTSFNMSGSGSGLLITAFRLSYGLGDLLAQQTLTTPTTVRVALGNNLVSRLPAVPEPETWSMFIWGFGMTCAAMRYRKRFNTRSA